MLNQVIDFTCRHDRKKATKQNHDQKIILRDWFDDKHWRHYLS